MHEVEYWLQVAALLGAKASSQALLHAPYTQADLLAVDPLLHALGAGAAGGDPPRLRRLLAGPPLGAGQVGRRRR